MVATLLRAIVTVALAAICALASTEFAAAQSRLFSCPHARVIELTVIGSSIMAAPIDGKSMRMNKDPRNSLRYFNGEYSVTLSPDQGQLLLEIPDWGSATCIYGTVNVKPLIPQQGAGTIDPCGPGFHQVPQTDRCDPNPGTNPNAQPRRTGTAEGKFPMGGQSLGGIMRSEPTMSSAKVMSLAAGNEVTLIERAGTMDEYDWFKVQFRGTTGYQWGGIMCSQYPIRGIFQQCEP